jgi:hypothetical protein
MWRCAMFRESSCCRRAGRGSVGGHAGADTGSALVAVVGLLGLLAVAASALLLLTSIEVTSAGHHRDAQELAHAADAALALGVRELQVIPTWTGALAGSSLADFRDTTLTPGLADGTVANLTELTAAVQAESDAAGSFGADTPRWRLFAYGPASSLGPSAHVSQAYLVIWIADDAADGDGNPEADANAIVSVRAEALGARFARRAVAASVRRADPAPSGLHLLEWRRLR